MHAFAVENSAARDNQSRLIFPLQLSRTFLNEDLPDDRSFELWPEDPRRGQTTFQAKTRPLKITWCDLLRRWLRKWGLKPTFTSSLGKVEVRGQCIMRSHVTGV